MNDQKGYKYLIDSVKLLTKKEKDFKLLIFGDDQMNGYYQNYCNKEGLDDYIIFCGNVENIYNVFYQADIFVSSSIYEGLPRAHIEALLCECPIVSTDIPGSNEVVLDGVNGILVPPKDSKTLNKALYQLLKSNGLRKIS